MATTSIEWTDRSINPVRARNRETGAVGHFCEKVSPGCTNCYASTWNERVRPSGKHLIGTGLTFDAQNRDKIEFFLDESKLQEVLRRRIPTKWFWSDMTDLFGAWVPDEWIDRCFAVMALTPWHTHQVLTKRAELMREYSQRIADGLDHGLARAFANHRPMQNKDWAWPLSNVWLGVSVEDQPRADQRIPLLLQTPAAIRFISAEPLLGPIEFDGIDCWPQFDYRPTYEYYRTFLKMQGVESDGKPVKVRDGLDWVIVGGESGPGARPFDITWARMILRQCRAASVPVFIKQLGARPYNGGNIYAEQAVTAIDYQDRKGGDPDAWPEDLRVRQYPEVRAS